MNGFDAIHSCKVKQLPPPLPFPIVDAFSIDSTNEGKIYWKVKKKKKENFYINSFKELRANELVNGGLLTIETKKKEKIDSLRICIDFTTSRCVKGLHTSSLAVNRASPTKNNWRSKNVWRIENFFLSSFYSSTRHIHKFLKFADTK